MATKKMTPEELQKANYWTERAEQCVRRTIKDLQEANEYMRRSGIMEVYVIGRQKLSKLKPVKQKTEKK